MSNHINQYPQSTQASKKKQASRQAGKAKQGKAGAKQSNLRQQKSLFRMAKRIRKESRERRLLASTSDNPWASESNVVLATNKLRVYSAQILGCDGCRIHLHASAWPCSTKADLSSHRNPQNARYGRLHVTPTNDASAQPEDKSSSGPCQGPC